jgi:two-component system, chemotaxis family, sensor kinase Cph1
VFPRQGGEPGREQERKVVYFIRNYGVGFDVQYSNKLFGVFQHLHDAEGYEGIGLAGVRRTVSRHAGRAKADVCLGRGATFYFLLPRFTENSDG